MPDIVFVNAKPERFAEWQPLMARHLPESRLVDYRALSPDADIDAALVRMPPRECWARLPGLRLICNLGMGVDALMRDPGLPAGVPVTRIVDPNMIEQMSEYVLYAVLHFHRRMDVYRRNQRAGRWQELPLPHTAQRRIGILGLGTIGRDTAAKLRALGFPLAGWSATRKAVEGVTSYAGEDELPAFLGASDILVCLPLTPGTERIVGARTLAMLPRGACVINLARGGLVDEEALLDALDRGQVGGAFLDVTRVEPLPAAHRLWSHPAVWLTPHIAGLTNAETSAGQIAANIRRMRQGEPLEFVVDTTRGY